MNKELLIKAVAVKTGMTQKATKEVVDAVFETIAEALAEGNEVKVTNFGKFSTSVRAARTGHNPQNPAEEIEIPETTVVKFKPSSVLKVAVK